MEYSVEVGVGSIILNIVRDYNIVLYDNLIVRGGDYHLSSYTVCISPEDGTSVPTFTAILYRAIGILLRKESVGRLRDLTIYGHFCECYLYYSNRRIGYNISLKP
jgi:hypothetical protein